MRYTNYNVHMSTYNHTDFLSPNELYYWQQAVANGAPDTDEACKKWREELSVLKKQLGVKTLRRDGWHKKTVDEMSIKLINSLAG